MSFFKKLFRVATSPEDKKKEQKSPFLAEKKDDTPIDELFMRNFVNNGGKFLYCLDYEEVKLHFENILEENDWFEKEVLCMETSLYKLLDENKLPHKDIKNPAFLFAGCENLIAEEGSVLFSSKQVKQYKPNDLPVNMVIFATTSQIVPSKSDGLRGIKNKYKTDYPTNITTFRYFKKEKNESFMNYGSIPKNLYLLLLEDL